MDTSGTLLPTWIVSLSTFGTLVVALLAVAFAVREHRNARESFIQTMRSEWRALQPSWTRVLLAQHGADFYYADATPKVRARAAKLNTDLRTPGLYPAQNASLALRGDVRPVTRFLSYAADSVLRGRWKMSEAYEVLGPDVARHHETIRALSHRAQEPNWITQSTEFNNFDEQDCVYLFAHLLRAEQCRRGDTYAHFAVDLAVDMRERNRDELKRCIHRVTRTRHRLYLPFRVQLLLRRGRHPRLAAAYKIPEDPIISGTQRKLYRRPFEPMLVTRARIWSARRRSGLT